MRNSKKKKEIGKKISQFTKLKKEKEKEKSESKNLQQKSHNFQMSIPTSQM